MHPYIFFVGLGFSLGAYALMAAFLRHEWNRDRESFKNDLVMLISIFVFAPLVLSIGLFVIAPVLLMYDGVKSLASAIGCKRYEKD